MKNTIGFSIANTILYGILALFIFVVDLVAGIELGDTYLVYYLFYGIFMTAWIAGLAFISFLAYKKPILSFVVMLYAITSFGLSLVNLVAYIIDPYFQSWSSIISFVFYLVIMVLAIIQFSLLKPFNNIKEDVKDNDTAKNIDSATNLDTIKEAKELLDAGAITSEEFYAIKYKVLNK